MVACSRLVLSKHYECSLSATLRMKQLHVQELRLRSRNFALPEHSALQKLYSVRSLQLGATLLQRRTYKTLLIINTFRCMSLPSPPPPPAPAGTTTRSTLYMQVRLAACHAARALLSSCTDSFREDLLPLLLPQLCFNRWHESDGVRLYSQDTWQQALKGNGPLWLARCLPQVSITSFLSQHTRVITQALYHSRLSCPCQYIFLA